MKLVFAHFRNRFCMFRTYYGLATGRIEPEGMDISVIEVADPPSDAQPKALVSGDVDVADLYFPTFLEQAIAGAPIVGIATEWKTTARGNGIFVRADSAIRTPGDLGGCLIGTHQGPHVVHRYLLRRLYAIDDNTLRWESHPQQDLIGVLKTGRVDAAVLIDQIFCLAERDPELRCLYTDGEGWKALTGFSEMVKHIIAIREPFLRDHPGLPKKLLSAFKASLDYSQDHLAEIAEAFIERYGGEREILVASARYPKIEFTFTPAEQRIAEAEMEMLFEMGHLSCRLTVAPLFVA
ncbi:MAG: ABC transporter substrate-binding protein [Deltaproteobacteria bacterium]|nr:ABC transporter substrate-binding protein [Deltaproteobacteria bacterium]